MFCLVKNMRRRRRVVNADAEAPEAEVHPTAELERNEDPVPGPSTQDGYADSDMETTIASRSSDEENDGGSDRTESPSLYFGNSFGSSQCSDRNSDGDNDDDDDISLSFFDDNTDRSDMKFMSSKRIGLDALNKPLTNSLRISKFETLVMVLHLAMRHGMTDVFVEDLLHFVNVIVGEPNAIPDSKFLFNKLFSAGSKPSIQFYCPDCELYLGLSTGFSEVVGCKQCGKEHTVASLNGGYYFVTLDIKRQISDVLARPHLKLTERNFVPGVVSDIASAELYECLAANNGILSNPNALTINFNTDGSPVFKSGPNSLWPVNFVLNEIHPSQRFWAENMMLAGLWFGKKGAIMDVFLQPFIKDLKLLKKDGVVWNRNGVVVQSPVYALSCIADSVARPKVQKFHQFNSSFACPYCEHPNTPITYYEAVPSRKKFSGKKKGTFVRPSLTSASVDDSAVDSPLYEKKSTLRYLRGAHPYRTNKKVRELMKLVKNSNESVMGVAGESPLCSLKYFDMVFGFGLDYMHATLIGVTKRLAELWFDSSGETYSVGPLCSSVDRRLSNIVMPSGMRNPRPMSERVHWHANEWRGFLLYYGLPCLVDILPSIYYDHFKKLVLGIYILSKESMLKDEVETANRLLVKFVWEYQDLYGEKNMVYNVHLTTHLAKVVSKLGALWNFSMFPYESANGRLVRMVKGTTGVATQIARKYQMTTTFSKLIQSNYEVSDECLAFCSKIVGYKYAKHHTKFENVTLIGMSRLFNLTEEQQEAFARRGINCGGAVQAHHTAVFNSTAFRGIQSSKTERCGDSCVRLKSGQYALIDLIVKVKLNDNDEGNVFCVCRTVNVSTEPCPFMVPHIKRCCLDPFGDISIVEFDDIASKSMFFMCDDKYFVSDFANTYECD